MSIRTHGLTLIITVVALIPCAGLVPPSLRAAAIHQSAGQSCAATGAYSVGNSAARGGARTPQIVPPGFPLSGYLSGTLTVTTYTGCGAPTSGHFTVHQSSIRGILPGPAGSPGAAPRTPSTAIVIPYLNMSVISATGTFQQDPAHKTDPEYVLVGATVRYGPVGISCTGVCPTAGSPTTPLVSRTVTFHDVTGYLRIQNGKPAMAGIMFLPPPDAQASAISTMLAPQPVSFWGARTS